MSEPPTDDDLLARLRAGDDHALETLLSRHAPAVLRYASRMCRNPEDARDVLQDTLLAAARGVRNFRGESSLGTWLFTVARSYCIKKRRGPKGAAATVPLDDDAASAVMAEASAPDERVESRELGEALEAAIRALEPGYREVLVLRDVEGLSTPEVAHVLGIGVDAVKSRLHRARVAVRERLEPWFTPGGEATAARAAGRDCGDIGRLFSRYLEGEIGAAECEAMQQHVAVCPACGPACEAFKRVVSLCRTTAGADVPVEVQQQLRRAIRVAIRRA